LEGSNKILDLLKDIVSQGKGILDLIVQAPHEGSMFCRVIPLNVGGIASKFYIIGGEVAAFLLEHL
jgi:hypothetical protein